MDGFSETEEDRRCPSFFSVGVEPSDRRRGKVRAPQQTTITSESWFPPELIAQGNVTGDDALNGLSYAANAFFQDPYNDGRITRIQGTDYFILEMSAK